METIRQSSKGRKVLPPTWITNFQVSEEFFSLSALTPVLSAFRTGTMTTAHLNRGRFCLVPAEFAQTATITVSERSSRLFGKFPTQTAACRKQNAGTTVPAFFYVA